MPGKKLKASEAVKTAEGRQYHINLAPGELAEYVLLCGDPARASKVASLFDVVTCERANREFITYTGRFQGVPVSVIGTGIGASSTEIVFVEAIQLYEHGHRPTMIRVGSCGSLQPFVAVGDMVISSGSVRLEDTSQAYVDQGYPAVAHHEVVLALIAAAERVGASYHVGLTATSSGFFGGQGRAVAGLSPRRADIASKLATWNVLNMEMESSTLFTLGSLARVRTGTVCAVYANRVTGEMVDDRAKHRAEEIAIQIGLAAVLALVKVDTWKAGHQKEFFVPSELSGV